MVRGTNVFAWVLIVATTIVSNIAVFSDQTGHGNQSHLVYASNQQRWWLFYTDSKTATTVKTMVSSSNDLTTATWSAGTTSPAMGSAMNAVDQRYMACLFLNPSSSPTTDAVHVCIGQTPAGTSVEHIRATFTGASSISWDASWNNTSETGNANAAIGMALGVGSDGFIHEVGCAINTNGLTIQWARRSSNADTTASWTNGWGAGARTDNFATPSVFASSAAVHSVGSGAMVGIWDGAEGNDGVNSSTVRSNKYSSGTTWPTAGAASTGGTSTSQSTNDWASCAVDTSHVYRARRTGTNTFEMRFTSDGSTWSSKTAPPNQNHLAGGGILLATDGTNMWMFVLDSAANNPVQYIKYTVSSDTWDAAWTQLESAGSTARNSISGSPAVGNNQIGVIYTAVNGSNFDIVLSALQLPIPSVVAAPQIDVLTLALTHGFGLGRPT